MRENCADFLPLPNILKADDGGQLLETNEVWGALYNNLFKALFAYFISDILFCIYLGGHCSTGYENEGSSCIEGAQQSLLLLFHEMEGKLAGTL